MAPTLPRGWAAKAVAVLVSNAPPAAASPAIERSKQEQATDQSSEVAGGVVIGAQVLGRDRSEQK